VGYLNTALLQIYQRVCQLKISKIGYYLGSYGQEFSVLILLTHGVQWQQIAHQERSLTSVIACSACIFRLDGLPVTF